MTTVLALDQGTTGSTALVIDRGGRVLGRGYREIPQHYPAPGQVEHDPQDLFQATVAAAREAIAASGVVPAVIGITNQRETVVAWERATGRAVHRAIVWQDRRTAARCAALARTATGPRLAARTGLVLDPYFSATKIEWMLRHVRGLARRVRAGEVVFGTVDTWLIHRLTGGAVFATDPTNASRTLLYDLDAAEWSTELCRLFGVPRDALPEIRPSSGDFGVAAAEHFGHPIPIAGVAGDQQAALFGQGCWRAGQAKNTYGTGAFLVLHTGTRPIRSRHGLLTTVACGPRGERAFALEGSVFIAGAAVQWLRDGLGLIASAAETEALARSVSGTDGVTFVPAFVGLGAPHWNAAARGTIVGLTRGSSRAHLVRAALEAMAFHTKEVLDAMSADARVRLTALRVDGGAAANDFLMQFQADLLGVPVQRPDLLETTALGAAGLAGLATGVWRDPAEFLAPRRLTYFRPVRASASMRARLVEWRRAVAAALHWAGQRTPRRRRGR